MSNSTQHNKLRFTHLSAAVTINHLDGIRLSCDPMFHAHHTAERSTSNQCFNVVLGCYSWVKFCLVTLALTTKKSYTSAFSTIIILSDLNTTQCTSKTGYGVRAPRSQGSSLASESVSTKEDYSSHCMAELCAMAV